MKSRVSMSGLPPEVIAVKAFTQIVQNDARFTGLNAHQSALLIKQDKILRSMIVPKLSEHIIMDNVDPAKLSAALGFDITDIDTDLQLEVIDTPEYHEML